MPFSEMITQRTAAISSLWNLSDLAKPLNVISDKLTNGDFTKIHIHRDDDLDGYVSSKLMNLYLDAVLTTEVERTTVPVSHGKHFDSVLDKLLEGNHSTTLFIVLDQALTLERYQKYMATGAHVLWIDHHDATVGNDPEVMESPLFDFIHSHDSTAKTTENLLRRFFPKGNIVFNHIGSILLSRLVSVVDAYDTYRFWLLDDVITHRHEDQTNDAFPIGLNGLFRDGVTDVLDKFFQHYGDYARDLATGKIPVTGNEGERILKDYNDIASHYFQLEARSLDAFDQIMRIADKVAKDHTTVYLMPITRVAEDDKTQTIDTVRLAITESSTYVDQVATKVMTRHQDTIDYALIHYTKNDLHRFSVRSDRFDCAELAKRFGGGGRERTAGFSLTLEEYIQFLKTLTLKPATPAE